MDIISVSLPSNEKNIKKIREFAREKQFSVSKVPNEDLWNLKDMLSQRGVLERVSFMQIYEYLCHCDD